MKNRRRSLRRALQAGLVFCACAAAQARLFADSVSRSLPVMGSHLEIHLEGDNAAALEAAANEAFKEARRLEFMLSSQNPNSEVSRINRAGSQGPVQVTDDMLKFILLSNRMSYLCDGFFDITDEPIRRLWTLHAGGVETSPDDDEVKDALSKVNSNNIDISFRNNTVRFLQTGMGIAPGPIEKGYTLDRCLKKIQSIAQVRSASLIFRTECLFWSKDPAHHFFNVRHPLSPESTWDSFSVSTFSAISAIATSGTLEDPLPVNPKTGRLIKNEIRSVSVISTSGAEARALSAAIFCMGLDEGSKFSETLADSAVLILYDQAGKLNSFKSENWNRIVQPQI